MGSLNAKIAAPFPGVVTRRLLMLAPIALLVTMPVVFRLPADSPSTGLARGFLVYWLVWGLAIPILLAGPRQLLGILVTPGVPGSRIPWWVVILLGVPPLIGIAFVFPGLFPDSGDRTLAALLAYALINGILEEVFWRGLFARAFAGDIGRGLWYPAVMYAGWLVIALTAGGPWFAVDALAVFGAGLGIGLLFGWVAWRTGSIRWTVMSHVLMNLGGVGALVVFAR